MTQQSEALRLGDWLEDQYDPTHNQAQAAAELRRLVAENEALKADAARYRYMRDAVMTTELLVYNRGCDLDAAVDAAMKEKT